jgi:hypothetical protein
MSVFFTVAIIYICYDLTVKTRNRRELKRLNNKVYQLEQLLEMALLYGKEKSKKTDQEAERPNDTRLDA